MKNLVGAAGFTTGKASRPRSWGMGLNFKNESRPPLEANQSRLSRGMSALCQKRTSVMCVEMSASPLSVPRRTLGDDIDDLERHHYFADLIDYLDERGDRAAIGL